MEQSPPLAKRGSGKGTAPLQGMPFDKLRANGSSLGMSTPVVTLPEEGLRCYVGSGDCHVVLPKEGQRGNDIRRATHRVAPTVLGTACCATTVSRGERFGKRGQFKLTELALMGSIVSEGSTCHHRGHRSPGPGKSTRSRAKGEIVLFSHIPAWTMSQ